MGSELAVTELFGHKLDGQRTLLVAEAGTEYWARDPADRRLRAISLGRKARRAGADAVKFQLFVPNEPLFCPVVGDEHRWNRWNLTLMGGKEWQDVIERLSVDGMPVFFSVFQHRAVELTKILGVPCWKVASRAAKTFPYDAVPGPFIVSNGFGLPEKLPENSLILQCTPKYPAPIDQSWWKGDTDGLSDHSGTTYPANDAIIRGCKLIELHLRHRAGPDFAAGLGVREFQRVARTRDDFAAMRADRVRGPEQPTIVAG